MLISAPMINSQFDSLRRFLSSLTNIPQEQWNSFQNLLQKIEVSAKTKLLEQGTTPQYIYFVERGLLKTSFIENSGKEITKGFVWENRLCAPYVSILTKTPANLNIFTLEESELIVLDVRQLAALYHAHPCWHDVSRKVTEGLLVERERREHELLAYSAEIRYKEFIKNFSVIHDRVPQYEIASYLGITPVALSQIRAKWRNTGDSGFPPHS